MTMLTVGFFFVAMLYASIGFGGGSTYTALLLFYEVDYRVVPVISLCCNILVVSGGCFTFYKAGYLSVKKALPFVLTSVPAAFVGGSLQLPEGAFIKVLAIVLLISSLQMLFMGTQKALTASALPTARQNKKLACGVGAFLGLLAGITGIGGGIFLAPVLYWLRWANQKTIAALCSFFILVNSIAGLLGHLFKDSIATGTYMVSYAPLFLAVILGGLLGSWAGCFKINYQTVQRITGLLILFVALRLIYQGYF